jgi:uncharacterized membrane protein (UPF0136 family)
VALVGAVVVALLTLMMAARHLLPDKVTQVRLAAVAPDILVAVGALEELVPRTPVPVPLLMVV